MSSNGSNARLDRIEKLIEEMALANKETERANKKRERANKERERANKEFERANKEFERANNESHARHVREMAEIREIGRKTRVELRRWAALGVKEARNQRKRQREIDENITRLSAAQLITEEKLQQFISSLGPGRNGH